MTQDESSDLSPILRRAAQGEATFKELGEALRDQKLTLVISPADFADHMQRMESARKEREEKVARGELPESEVHVKWQDVGDPPCSGMTTAEGHFIPFAFTNDTLARSFAIDTGVIQSEDAIPFLSKSWRQGLWEFLSRDYGGCVIDRGSDHALNLDRKGIARTLGYIEYEEYFSKEAQFVLTYDTDIMIQNNQNQRLAFTFNYDGSASAGRDYFRGRDPKFDVARIPTDRFLKEILDRQVSWLVVNPAFRDEHAYMRSDLEDVARSMGITIPEREAVPSEEPTQPAEKTQVEVTDDLNDTHGILNLLYAGYQGRFVALNILGQLGSREYQPDAFEETKTILDRTGAWAKEMWAGTPLFFHGKAQEVSPEAQEALEYYRKLKKELTALAPKVRRILHGNLQQDEEGLKILIASMGRYAYGRDHFIKNLVSYGDQFNRPDVADRWRQHLLYCQQDVGRASVLFDTMKQSAAVTASFAEEVRQETLFLPGIFKSQVADMDIMLLRYRGLEISYEALGMDAMTADLWQKAGFNPQQALYWSAYELDPGSAVDWLEAGVVEPGAAGGWKLRGYTPAEATPWIQMRFNASSAHPWIRAGFTLPDIAAGWAREGFTPREARDWIAQGINDPKTAAERKSSADLTQS
ncbi:MAG TPA: hypothetical protein PK014_09270 [Thermoanaerobaculia bacterium]|nr:hypothetical protein [Thermoanaerobaculia bacterium]HUM30376.1 hypothetical protein [Thermoanaerobaculia bacterium]HXK68613.1 hypothetical protein [Thermoanaerobaculia bacterium]